MCQHGNALRAQALAIFFAFSQMTDTKKNHTQTPYQHHTNITCLLVESRVFQRQHKLSSLFCPFDPTFVYRSLPKSLCIPALQTEKSKPGDKARQAVFHFLELKSSVCGNCLPHRKGWTRTSQRNANANDDDEDVL